MRMKESSAVLLRYAVRRVGPDAASDVVADAFLVAWRRRTEVPTDSTRLWLFQVAARLVANERRADIRPGRLSDRAATDPTVRVAVPDPADAVVERIQVLAALAKLPARDQEALRLIEWDGLRIVDAACIAGCSPPAFRVRLPHQKEVAEIVVLAPEVSDNNPCRDSC